MIPIYPWISSPFPSVLRFSTLIKEKCSGPTAAQHTNQMSWICTTWNVSAAHDGGDNARGSYTQILPALTWYKRKREVFVYILRGEADCRPVEASMCHSFLSWEQIEHQSPVHSCSKPVSIPWWLSLAKRVLGECYKSPGNASSVSIVTHMRARTPLIQPQDKSISPWWIHYSLMGLFYIVCFG